MYNAWLTRCYLENEAFISIKRQKPLSSLQDISCIMLCKGGYIGKSKRNMTTKWGEHDNSIHDFEPAKHLHKSTAGQS